MMIFTMIYTHAFCQPVLLDPVSHQKFEMAIPKPAKIDATTGGNFQLSMEETTQWLGLLSSTGDTLYTTVWGYGYPGAVTYPGPTFEAKTNVPVDTRWENALPDQHFLPIDPTVHVARPINGGVPVVVHLHGGHTESASDGLPDAWYTKGFEETGADFVKETLHYDNDQESATLWYHDHALGITRLNVYAGLAGFYLLRDDNELSLMEQNIIPTLEYEQEIVIQDRMFTADGQLFLPAESPVIHEDLEESILAEFFGDFILVNGVLWPYMEVEPRKYRIRLLNGSDSRFYVLSFDNGMSFYQIGTDNGLLNKPVVLNELIIAPGERMDLVLDFSGLTQGTEITLTNRGPDEPFRGLNPDGSLSDGDEGVLPAADPQTTGLIMKFKVNKQLSDAPDATLTTESSLRQPIEPFDLQNATVRRVVLFEGEDEYGRLRPQLGIYDPESEYNGSMLYEENITEMIELDATEIWEIYNATEDAHPVHLHLVAFQLIDRERYEGEAEIVGEDDIKGGTKQELIIEELSGVKREPALNEKGWKDTAIALPKQVTRVVAHFDREGKYVWHCHILSHEDHEMMRPFMVQATTPVTDLAVDKIIELGQNQPNPFRHQTLIPLHLKEAMQVALDVYDMQGKHIRQLLNGKLAAGDHQITWDGRSAQGQILPAGSYFYVLQSNDQVIAKKMITIGSR